MMAHPPLAIRRYEAKDRATIKALWQLTLEHAQESDRDLTLAERNDCARLFVGEVAGVIVASVLAGHDGHRGWLHRVATHPDHRRRGYALQLIAVAEAWLKSCDVPKVNLQVRGVQPDIQAVYERAGYAVEDRTSMGKRLVPMGTPLMPRMIELTVTYLEMTQAPQSPPPPMPAIKLAVLRASPISVGYYRYLYHAVGERWLWWERKLMHDEVLAAVLADPKVEIHVPYVAGEPAGFVELDGREAGVVEVRYFGLAPPFIGRGIGPWFLRWSLDTAWSRRPDKVQVNTCTLDHPKALSLYQRMGFAPVRQERKLVRDPRDFPTARHPA